MTLVHGQEAMTCLLVRNIDERTHEFVACEAQLQHEGMGHWSTSWNISKALLQA